MNIFTHTRAGKAIITHKALTSISDDNYPGSQGTVSLGLLFAGHGDPVWCLFWEFGADYNVFEDDARFDKDVLEAWMPSAVREAVAEAQKLVRDIDLDWFLDWADTAEETLNGMD